MNSAFLKSSVIFLFIFAAANIFSQTVYSIGVKAGCVSNIFVFESSDIKGEDTKSKTGGILGISFELFKSRHFMLMPEVYYIERGGITEPSQTGFNTRDPTASYASIVILAVYRQPYKFITPYIFAGPRAETMLVNNLNAFDNRTSGTFGLTLGAGLEKDIAKQIMMSAEIKYERDFSSFVSFSTVGGEKYSYKNSSFNILVGAHIKLAIVD